MTERVAYQRQGAVGGFDGFADAGAVMAAEIVQHHDLLRDLDDSLQGNRTTREGNEHPDRNAQFEYIAATIADVQSRGQPVISVDTKKKELVGPIKNGGHEWRPEGQTEEVRVHDFLDPELGKAIPYGVSDLRANEGWDSVGIHHDTAQFATAWLTFGPQ